jgi:hypothetical protein
VTENSSSSQEKKKIGLHVLKPHQVPTTKKESIADFTFSICTTWKFNLFATSTRIHLWTILPLKDGDPIFHCAKTKEGNKVVDLKSMVFS